MKLNHTTKRFTAEVADSRQTFLRSLTPFPSLLGRVVERNYQKRIKRARGKPMLGEWAPWLLADLLDIKDKTVIRSIVPSWMNLYAYTLCIDDILDRRNEVESTPLLIASGLLLERGISGFFRELPRNGTVRIQLDDYFLEVAGAAMEEMTQHKYKLSKFTRCDVDGIGKKVSFLKLCAAELLAVSGKPIVGDVLIPIENLATGMQLLDDMTDWEEDWKAGSYSHLLTETFINLRKLGIICSNDPQALTRSEVFCGMILTGSLEKCLKQALVYLQRVISNPSSHSGKAAQFLDLLIQENTDFLEEVVTTRKASADLLRQKSRSSFTLDELTNRKLVKRKIQDVERKLQIVAQSS